MQCIVDKKASRIDPGRGTVPARTSEWRIAMKLGNMIGMGLRSAGYLALRRRCPVNVMLAVTNRCNARCNYCKIPTRQDPDMTTAQILRLIDDQCPVDGNK